MVNSLSRFRFWLKNLKRRWSEQKLQAEAIAAAIARETEPAHWKLASETGSFTIGIVKRREAIEQAAKHGYVAYVDDENFTVIVTRHKPGNFV